MVNICCSYSSNNTIEASSSSDYLNLFEECCGRFSHCNIGAITQAFLLVYSLDQRKIWDSNGRIMCHKLFGYLWDFSCLFPIYLWISQASIWKRGAFSFGSKTTAACIHLHRPSYLDHNPLTRGEFSSISPTAKVSRRSFRSQCKSEAMIFHYRWPSLVWGPGL